MRKLIVIDACMRDGESRTRRILEPLAAELGKRYEIETIVLDGDDYRAVGRKTLAERNKKDSGCGQARDCRPVLGHELPGHIEGLYREYVAVQYHFQGQRNLFRWIVQVRKSALHYHTGHECTHGRPVGCRYALLKGARHIMGIGRGDHDRRRKHGLQHPGRD